jgi:hypothetical protein
MDTSDDVSSLFGGGGDSPDLPSQEATQSKRTATALPQSSQASDEAKRLRASSLTKGFAPVRLGEQGLLGIGA